MLSPIRRADSARARTRAEQLHGLLDPIAQRSRTTAVLRASGLLARYGLLPGSYVASSRTKRLALVQREQLQRRECEIDEDIPGLGGHAERKLVDGMRQMGVKRSALGVSRPICPECQTALEA